ncbi:MAG: glycosyltransferase family 2 protein, partial [Bacteroidales bacterium]|nr:glycosyltransferase family 2 protein [Bacteroidales bacterium]
YKDRFDSCLKPLLPKVASLFPKEQVIVIANGHYQREQQGRYIERFNAFCSRYGRIMTVTYADPVGLSRLWNRIIEEAQYPKVLILNDDILIRPGFRRLVRRLMTRNEPLVTVNGSWSHFLITTGAVESVGLFDEGLREIGGEDDDYLARMAFAGVMPGNMVTSTISGRSKRRMKAGGLNSYGRDMSVQVGGYSTLNTEYLLSKWETSDSYFEGAVEVPGRKTRYWKPRVALGDKEK